MSDIDMLAAIVDTAARDGRAIAQLSLSRPLVLEEAYAVQSAMIQLRLQRGERLVGVKMGFTSHAKMVQMGVDDLIWGRLTDAMQVAQGTELDLEHFIHPRIEPEIAFRLKSPLSGSVSIERVMAATDAVAPALEIIDSRYRDFRFSLPDVVADNSSASGFILGTWQAYPDDLGSLDMVMEIDGHTVETGSSAAILGDPWHSLVAAARLAGAAGVMLEPGWVVLAGAATAAWPLAPGIHVRLRAGKLGSVEIHTALAEVAS